MKKRLRADAKDANAPKSAPPRLLNYHESVTEELHVLKDRIRYLVQHWPTDGEHKELALRAMLRRHLPASFLVGRGFVVTREEASTQIDVLVVDGSFPMLFKDGDLMIVTPDAVRGVIEVKTQLEGVTAIQDATAKLTRVQKICRDSLKEASGPWSGLFVYEGPSGYAEQVTAGKVLLQAAGAAFLQTSCPINCISYGRSGFVRYWSQDEITAGRAPEASNDPRRSPFWHSYRLTNLAPAYFLGNLLDFLTVIESATSEFAWFPIEKGKEPHKTYCLIQGESIPIQC